MLFMERHSYCPHVDSAGDQHEMFPPVCLPGFPCVPHRLLNIDPQLAHDTHLGNNSRTGVYSFCKLDAYVWTLASVIHTNFGLCAVAIITVVVIAAFSSPTALSNAYGYVKPILIALTLTCGSQFCRRHCHVHNHHTASYLMPLC